VFVNAKLDNKFYGIRFQKNENSLNRSRNVNAITGMLIARIETMVNNATENFFRK
jgi:hypothetical protein